MRLVGNLLTRALSVVGFQAFQYKAFTSRSTNDIGIDVATYADPVTVDGQFQPVPRTLFNQLGLDLQKNYAMVFIPQSVVPVDRDVSGDQILYQNATWLCESTTEWETMEGFTVVLCVRLR